MTTETPTQAVLDAADDPVMIETEGQLQIAQQQWRACAVLGVDTEFVRERTYRADVGLVQISDGHTAWLVDPVKLGSIESLADILARPETVKVLHSGSEDLEIFDHAIGQQPDPYFDTQIACALLGQPLQMSYHKAVQWLLDIEVDKDQTRSNWLKRPLSDRQLRYAALDVLLLPYMYRILRDRLQQIGRLDWLNEEVERMKASASQSVRPADAYLRFNRINKLDDESMRVLQALAEWRERAAKNRNLARGFVLNDKLVLKLVEARPATMAEFRAVEDLHPRFVQRHGAHLLDAIAMAVASDKKIYVPEELNGQGRARLKRMRQQVMQTAESLGIDPAILASKRELIRLVRHLSSGEPLPARFTGWRQEVITDLLLKA